MYILTTVKRLFISDLLRNPHVLGVESFEFFWNRARLRLPCHLLALYEVQPLDQDGLVEQLLPDFVISKDALGDNVTRSEGAYLKWSLLSSVTILSFFWSTNYLRVSALFFFT